MVEVLFCSKLSFLLGRLTALKKITLDIWNKKYTNVYFLLFEMLQLCNMAVKIDVKLTVVKIRHAI